MWKTTKWVVATWLKITFALALGCALTRWFAGPSWFILALIVSAVTEYWATTALAREWAFDARLSWWWTR